MRDEADADARGGSLSLEAEAHLLGLAADLLRDHECTRVVRLRQQHEELIAAVAVCGVHGANRSANAASEGAEHLVAALVPEAVVHRLETVHIDHEHREATLAAPGAAHLLLERGIQLAAVEEPGQRVDARQVAEHRTHPALVRREDTRQEREQPDSPHVQHDAEEARSRESVRRRIDRDDPKVHAGGQQRDRHGGPAAASKGDRHREQVQREDVR